MRVVGAGVFRASVVAALLLCPAVGAAAPGEGGPRRLPDTQGPSPLSGRRLLAFCDGVTAAAANAPTLETARCIGYVRGAVDTLDSLKKLGRISFCLPPDLTTKEVILLYKKEAAIFPQVLESRASDLIAGMVVKFFPCE